jgi:peptidase M28-like protein
MHHPMMMIIRIDHHQPRLKRRGFFLSKIKNKGVIMTDIFNELSRFYQTLNHQKVIELIEENLNIANYKILEDKYYRIWIPKTVDSPVPLLVAHSDTVFQAIPRKIVNNKGKIFCKNKGIGLGADDRNGCWLLSQMLQQRPNEFIFALFDMEEQGCMGSMSLEMDQIKDKISVIIGLDRQGKSDLALYGFESDELLQVLESIQSYEICFGTLSDCATLAENSGICCFNISVGYYRQHTSSEYTIVTDLKKAKRLLLDLPKTLWGKQYEADLFQGFDEDLYDDTLDICWPWSPLPKRKTGRW